MKKILFLISLILSAVTYEISGQEFLTQLDDYSEQSTPLIPTQSTPVNFIKTS